MQKKLFLLDAFALIFRAYYALILNPRITSKGKNTNAQFGFTNTLFELINKEKPTHMAVCFDIGGSVARITDFADYKANRQDTPEDLIAAVPDIKKIIEHLKQRGIGILITEHNVRETLGICDRAYIVNAGKVIAEGTAETIVANKEVREVYLGKNFSL